MNDKPVISHVRPSDMCIQTNEEHCLGVAELAEMFAAEFGLGQMGRIMGMLHDKGKEQAGFQRYIRSMSGYDPSVRNAVKTPHAYVGMLVAKKFEPQFFPLIGLPICSHHAGLYDWTDFEALMSRQIPDDVNTSGMNIARHTIEKIKSKRRDIHHYVRMLFSSLVDADFIDTERFMQPEKAAMRRNTTSLAKLCDKLEAHLAALAAGAPATPVNEIRNRVQNECRAKADDEPGFYSLTVPTGGGKTLSSMLWALNHAVKHGKKRIIVAIPFTSIITQTAEVLRGIFGEENVLEHHSAVNIDDMDDGKPDNPLKLAAENWDCPIVVTTNVQLLESLYASKPSKCRKLHNLCNSVLILDEVQALPVEHLQPVVDALKALKAYFGTTVLFTTASMPALCGTHRGTSPLVEFTGIENITEIIPPSMALHDKLRRVELSFDKDSSDYDEIASRIAGHERVLCIVNTRRDALEIFSRLPDEGLTVHLSKMMCPAHIRQTISLVKEALRNPEQRIIRVVATQLIEAGVDIDFPVVYRQEAGLDSILQAAGRCNREGRLPQLGRTHVFSLSKEHPLPPGHISATAAACRSLGITGSTDCFAPATILDYFRQLYCRTATFDTGPDSATSFVADHLYDPVQMSFATVGQQFRLIDDNSVSIIVNTGNSPELVAQLKACGISRNLMRRLGQYSVQVRERDFKALVQNGLVEEISEGVWYMPDASQYRDDTGLTTDNHWLEEILIK